MRRRGPSGAAPRASASARTIGDITPPPRAVFDGINGPRTSSLPATAYPRPSVVPPQARIKTSAIRRPNPVRITTSREQKRRDDEPDGFVGEARQQPLDGSPAAAERPGAKQRHQGHQHQRPHRQRPREKADNRGREHRRDHHPRAQ